MSFQIQKPQGGMGKRLIPLFVIVAVIVALMLSPAKKLIVGSAPTGVKALTNDVGTNVAKNVKVVLPTGRPIALSADKVFHVGVMQWNAQLAPYLGNGGPITTVDSLIAKYHGQVKIINENDTDAMKDQLVAAATEWAKSGGSGNPAAGFQGVIFMGDGMPGYLPGWNEQLHKVCKTYKLDESLCEVRMIGSVGSSYGEDKIMVPVEIKNDPKQALFRVSGKRITFAAYFWDGDHVVGLDWVSQNTDENGQPLKVNPNADTFDDNMVNFMNPKDYLDAVDKYIAGFCEERIHTVDGKRVSGPKVTACVGGVATWTPGDWNVAHSAKDTLVTALSTRENRNQMSATVVVINGWAKQNADTLAALFAGSSQAADMIKTSDAALRKAAAIAVQIYGSKAGLTADQWAALYKGLPHKTQNGYQITLGGSRAWNLADNLDYYGMSGGVNIYDAVYTNIGNMISKLSPATIPVVRPLPEIFDASYLLKAKDLLGEGGFGTADVPTYQPGAVSEVYASRPYTINFDTGSATIQPGSMKTVRELYQELAKSDMKVSIIGHTDNTGSPELNRGLSERRADSVKRAIMAASGGSKFLPENRFSTEGHGQDEPVNPAADQNSASERASNRRVVIVLGR